MKKGYLLIIMGLLMISLMIMVQGAITSPSASATISGSAVSVTATVKANTTLCIINLSSSLSGNTSTTAISSTNTSVANTTWAVSLDTIPFNDASDYNLGMNCTTANVTESAGDVFTISNIVINNRVPDVPTDVTPIESISRNTFTVQATVTDKNTTSCNLGFNGNSPISAPSCSLTAVGGTNCSCVFTSVPDYKYDYFIYADDGRDTTASLMGTITVRSANSQVAHSGQYIVSPQQLQQAQAEQSGTTASSGVGFIDTIINGFKALLNSIFG